MPRGWSVSTQLETQARGFKMAEQNVTDATSYLNISDSTAQSASSIMQQQSELAVAASSDTLNDQQRQFLDTQYQQFTQEIDRLGNIGSTQPLATGGQVQSGANAGDTTTIPNMTFSAAWLGIAGTSIATAGGAQAAITSIGNALNTMNSGRSTIGAMTNTLGYTSDNLSMSEINTQAAQSVISDQDMAQAMTQLTTQNLLSQSAISALSKFSEISRTNALSLLQ